MQRLDSEDLAESSGPDTRPRPLPRSWRKPLLMVHLSAGAGIIGADLALLTLGVAGATGVDPVSVYPAMSMVSRWVLLPLAAVALLSGITQSAFGRYGFENWWVLAKLTLTTGLTVLQLRLLIPGLDRMADAAVTQDQGTLDAAVRFVLIPSVALPLLLFMVVLGVAKPGTRRRGGVER